MSISFVATISHCRCGNHIIDRMVKEMMKMMRMMMLMTI